jgi:hypothetical protein
MRVYLASMFSDKDRIKARGIELQKLGIECTSRWAYETIPHMATIQSLPIEYHRETAVIDVKDILVADKLVLHVPTAQMLVDAPPATSSRGGRHFEAGFVYGLSLAQMRDGGRPTRELIILGPKENVFHYLDGQAEASNYPTINRFDTWEEVKAYLSQEKERIDAA